MADFEMADANLSQASVAAALEAAAVKSDDMATEWGKKRESAWRKKNATEEARVFDGMSLAALTVADAILALPLEADHAALLAEAVKVLRDDIAAQHKRVMSGEQRFYAKNITNACSEMGGPLGNAVERLIAALSALETP